MRQRVDECGRAHPAAGRRQRRPAQSVQRFPAQYQVHPAAQRIGVDEQRAPPGPRRGHRETGGEHARTRAAAAAQDGHHLPGRRTVGELTQPGGEPALAGRQRHHVLDAELVGLRPVRWPGARVPADEYQRRPAAQPCPQTRGRRVDPDQYQRRPPVPRPCSRGIGRDVDEHAHVGTRPAPYMPPAVARFLATSAGLPTAVLESVKLDATADAAPLARKGGWRRSGGT